MSARRILQRRMYLAEHPDPVSIKIVPVPNSDVGAKVRVAQPRPTFHDWKIKRGERHATFQLNVRQARKSHGLRLTSSDMAHVHGTRIG